MLTLQIALSGILLGGLYACLAIGFSVIWGVTNLINLAHGSMAIMGAYVTWLLWSHTGLDPFLSIPSGSSTYQYDDGTVESGKTYQYVHTAQDCAPAMSGFSAVQTISIPS